MDKKCRPIKSWIHFDQTLIEVSNEMIDLRSNNEMESCNASIA